MLNKLAQESTTTVFEEYPNYGGDLPLTSGGVKACFVNWKVITLLTCNIAVGPVGTRTVLT